MRIVNDLGDRAVYDLICRFNSNYSKGESDYSITQLNNPPRIVHLTQRHWDQIEVRASNLIWSLWGSLGHLALSEVGSGLTEKRLFITVAGARISGQADHYVDGAIVDYKFTKAITLQFKDKLKDWEQQLNGYVWLFQLAGYEVTAARIVAILRDWDAVQARTKPEYPDSAVAVVPIPVWPDKKIESFITCKVNELERCKSYHDDDLPECSSKDMWERKGGFAVKIEGGKRALKILPSREEAEKYVEDNQGRYNRFLDIEERLGTRVRCESHCNVSQWCNQYAAYKGE